jgi:cytochrome P450
VCIGSAFALMEAKLVAAMVLRKYRLDLVPCHPVEPQAEITLRPSEGVRVTLHEA